MLSFRGGGCFQPGRITSHQVAHTAPSAFLPTLGTHLIGPLRIDLAPLLRTLLAAKLLRRGRGLHVWLTFVKRSGDRAEGLAIGTGSASVFFAFQCVL